MTHTTSAPQTTSLFDDEPKPQPKKTERPEPVYGLRPAEARLTAAHDPDPNDADQRPLLYLVVTCPYCDRHHIHPGGHAGAPRLCLRNARCIGQPGGTYYFPAVHQ